MSLIELVEVTFRATTGDRAMVLQPTTLEVQAGEQVAIMGPSGAGKTTLASIIGALQPASGGEYRFDGEPITGHAPRRSARFRATNVGFVFQSAHMIDERSVMENVALGLPPDRPRSRVREQVGELLERVGLAGKEDQPAATLSGGERQRAAVARALIKSPRLLIADEPTGSLDQANGAAVLDLLFGLPRDVTLLVVSHDPRIGEHASRVVSVVDGRVSG
ncbi:ABC transporter ATP-binding protein [Nocardioides sp. zg-536]|uniref:ABC transporter ATP-binding protein n=1 Tax=Nocardioides faecalis TaxID=2803858 RepID=A0A938Y9I3_9ACTN|nr:ABC transporter ATP-binding protein [Nocardioides faecalis]MBM9459724.1 ABC transporter ATP-binding protein [Nocardioides faecalis]MBS4753499.1 ABC transporter ATP-binding protein [Nocardioides faecalis]QVI58243.1 ABC transporter ATP-binding protein [Nocardioides faecalis]